MDATYLFGLFMVLTLLGVPLAFAMTFTVFSFVIVFAKVYPLQAVALAFIGGVEPYDLLAIPLFILAGELMTRGGIGQRLVTFSTRLLGFMTGGLGLVTVSTSMLFAGMSGSAVADCAAVGSVMIPGMQRRGYSPAFAAALVAVAGTIGIIIPPSIPMIIFAFVANVSVADLFIAGILPGLLFGICLAGWSVYIGRSRGWDLGGEPATLGEIGRSFVVALPALLLPVLILGGIFGGICTPTEAAAVAVVYALLVGLFLYGDLDVRALPEIVLGAFVTSATVMLVIGGATALAWIITTEGLPFQLVELLKSWTDSRIVFLLLANVLLLVLGMFIDTISALIITVPLLLPVARAFDVDLVHLGLIVTCNLAIGIFTPPVGFNLFVSTKIAGVQVSAVIKELIPLLVISIVILMLVSLVPDISLALVRVYHGS